MPLSCVNRFGFTCRTPQPSYSSGAISVQHLSIRPCEVFAYPETPRTTYA